MGDLTIEISSDGTPSYPRGNTVYPNDTVTFQLVGASGVVDVTFDPTSCCFTSSDPLALDSGSLAASQQQKTVSGDARAKQYLFWTNPPGQDSRAFRPPPHWETKTGTLDVSTDPPPPPKE